MELQRTLGLNTWPEFMQHDRIVNKYWHFLYTDFLRFQLALVDKDEIIGIGNSVPLSWKKSFKELPDSGLDWAIYRATNDLKHGSDVNLLVGLQILINEKYQGRGISSEMLKIMKRTARVQGIDNLALPVRPLYKHKFPSIQIEDYIGWLNKDGLPFDPWLRVHIRSGGKIVGLCKRSMIICGSVSEWEKWTVSKFTKTGNYYIEGALNDVTIDKEKDSGIYVEPNIWVVHGLTDKI